MYVCLRIIIIVRTKLWLLFETSPFLSLEVSFFSENQLIPQPSAPLASDNFPAI